MKLLGDQYAHFTLAAATLVAVAAVSSFSATASAQTVLYVDDDAPEGGDGSSWDTAFNDLQDALDVLVAPGEIRIAEGLYIPRARTNTSDPRSVTFQIVGDSALHGGYAGFGASDPNLRDYERFPTILSGDVDSNDGPNFANYDENAYHVIVGTAITNTATLQGLTIANGNANVDSGAKLPTEHLGGGIYLFDSDTVISHCIFKSNLAGLGGGLYAREGCDLIVLESSFLENKALNNGGAMRLRTDCTLDLSNCIFTGNEAINGAAAIAAQENGLVAANSCSFTSNDGIIGAIHCSGPSSVLNCTFHSNVGFASGALSLQAEFELSHCTFSYNESYAAGAVLCTGPYGSTISHCEFQGNSATWFGGALLASGAELVIDCHFSDNSAPHGGGIGAAGTLTVRNCTVANNSGGGIAWTNTYGSLDAANCIVWGNSPYQLAPHDSNKPPPPPLPGVDGAIVNFCNVQGGWTGQGANNINADPLFIQAGCGNLRLGIGSPCINAGDNSLIPPGITTDLDGNPRIIESIVDMGAYEGAHEPLPLAACENDLDNNEIQQLVPEGGVLDPLLSPAAFVINQSGQDNAFIAATQYDAQLHVGAGGFNEIGSKLAFETSLNDGAFFMLVFLPFDAQSLNGFPPEAVDLTYFNPGTNAYELAALGNIQSSPGHAGPLGDRIVVVGSTWETSLSPEIGDYGVFWNPELGKGFAWANVDHASDFAFGVPLPACLGDTSWPSDNSVDATDLTIVLDNWGAAPSGPANFADINQDGSVDVDDLVAVITGWGECK